MKIKVGDKVKIKRMDFDIVEGLNVGDTGIVEEIKPNLEYPIWVQLGENGYSYGFKGFELELIIN